MTGPRPLLAAAVLAVALVATLVLACAGCNGPVSRARVVGDTVYLPENCSWVKFNRTTSDKLPFVKFDGNYPSDWPDVFRLPPGTYLKDQGQLKSNHNVLFIAHFEGICRGTPAELVEFWRKQIAGNGWTITYAEDDKGASYPTAAVDGGTGLCAEIANARPAQAYMRIDVYNHRNTDGWVRFCGIIQLNDEYR